MYDIIIVGAGPAGLTAAIYARRAGKKTLVLEAKSYGGQIINTLQIENYPATPHISGYELATKIYEQATELGAEMKFEKVLEIENQESKKIVKTAQNTYETKTIILATGAENKKLGIENEEEFIGKGVSYCATCDGAFYKNKVVAVVGGGNTALEDALYLSNLASKVYVIHRREEFRGEETTLQDLKQKENIELIYNSYVTKINGEERLTSLEVADKEGIVRTIQVDGLFIAIGRVPENQSFAHILDLDEYGYIIAGEDCHTNILGIFVAGDNRQKEVRQLVTATSDGAIAATQAISYINNHV